MKPEQTINFSIKYLVCAQSSPSFQCLFWFDIPYSQEPLRNDGSFQNGVMIMKTSIR